MGLCGGSISIGLSLANFFHMRKVLPPWLGDGEFSVMWCVFSRVTSVCMKGACCFSLIGGTCEAPTFEEVEGIPME